MSSEKMSSFTTRKILVIRSSRTIRNIDRFDVWLVPINGFAKFKPTSIIA
eukprot:CAMPEP_0115706434 /NCGR_PEP_ID=MMETSP0272-20121206/70790_1 /TAXON_ID=71861 /ORGANISM="Scrippsiella trochoidea, Strain CCMP3099" /LENGTH=49 /DNA_ID= /DNA_START= /DNA_END= /DNA_ORIENTATION=